MANWWWSHCICGFHMRVKQRLSHCQLFRDWCAYNNALILLPKVSTKQGKAPSGNFNPHGGAVLVLLTPRPDKTIAFKLSLMRVNREGFKNSQLSTHEETISTEDIIHFPF